MTTKHEEPTQKPEAASGGADKLAAAMERAERAITDPNTSPEKRDAWQRHHSALGDAQRAAAALIANPEPADEPAQ